MTRLFSSTSLYEQKRQPVQSHKLATAEIISPVPTCQQDGLSKQEGRACFVYGNLAIKRHDVLPVIIQKQSVFLLSFEKLANFAGKY